MSIHDFHSKLSSRTEKNDLFEALRRLREVTVQILMTEEEEEEARLGGWYPWDNQQPAIENAVPEV